MTLLFKTVFGSHLYGTETPDSDLDYKAVYAPTLEELVLGKVKLFSSTNVTNKEDQHLKSDSTIYEVEYYTLHKFLKHAAEGQIVAIDMLYAPPEFWSGRAHKFWVTDVISSRDKFLSKNLNKFVQYAVKQAAKYGIKGSRLNLVNKYLKFFESIDGDTRLVDVIDDIAQLVGDISIASSVGDDPAKSVLVICGKQFTLTTRVKYVIDPLRKFISEYGKRVELAACDEGVDKKACSHAFRAAFEVRELVQTRNLVFPLREREFLRDIKTGKLTYNEFAPMLEDLVDEVRDLVDKSDLPDTPLIDINEVIKKYYKLYDDRVL